MPKAQRPEVDLPEPAPEPEDIDRVSREHRGDNWPIMERVTENE